MAITPVQEAALLSESKQSELNDTEKALLNILDDYTAEKSYSESTQRALLNILDDFSEERAYSDNTQKALLNILDDYRTEKENMEDTQRAFLNILEDYSEEKKKAESSNEDLIAANKENKELEQFAFVASHDLQEPLRTITNFVGLLEEKFGKTADEDTLEYLQFIVGAASKMQSLIKDLLELSRIGTNNRFAQVDLEKVLAEVIGDLDTSINECGALIYCTALPTLVGNEMELKRLFMNLMSNALKFRKKGVRPAITIGAVDRAGEWVFSVQDNGIGIEDHYREKIFIIFQRLHAVDEYPGTGIGLASCKKIASMHNGRIRVQSVHGEGSTFFINIPKDLKE